MTKQEKVIKGLECCILHNPDDHTRCSQCPYDGNCVNRLKMDALELLKAQEPRVMTLEELDAIYQTKEYHTWPFNTPPYLWMTVNPDARWIKGFWICWHDLMYSLENNTAFYVRENYRKTWKIWTAEPTDEQQRAVKWE